MSLIIIVADPENINIHNDGDKIYGIIKTPVSAEVIQKCINEYREENDDYNDETMREVLKSFFGKAVEFINCIPVTF